MKIGRTRKNTITIVKDGKVEEAKQCVGCEEVKQLNEFYSQKAGVAGRSSRCAVCLREYHRSRSQEKSRASIHNRRARKFGLVGNITDGDIEDMLKHFNYSCAFCGIPQTKTGKQLCIDHFIPLSSGNGGTTVGNLIPLCNPCNTSKSDSHPISFLEIPLTSDKDYERRLKNLMESSKKDTNYFHSKERAIRTISYLAEKNSKTMAEFERYVNESMRGRKDTLIF